MSTTSHIQQAGSRRPAVAAAIVAAAIGLVATAPSGLTGQNAIRIAGQSVPMPGGGCGASGC